MRFKLPIIFVALILNILFTSNSEAARLKDIINIGGVRNNQLIGFGLVVGLAGTGDSALDVTKQSTKMMLQRMGISSIGKNKQKNAASVMATVNLPPFSSQGTVLDVTIASLGDAKSLKDGVLLLTPLKGANGKIYAVAQGPVSVGGGVSAGGNNAKSSKGHTTVAKVVGGGIVEKEVTYDIGAENELKLSLKNQDFTTSVRIAKEINELFGKRLARSINSGNVLVAIPMDYQGKVSEFISNFEKIEIQQDIVARIIFNERTGTIVVGENVKVSTVAITHGNLTISVKEEGQKYVRDGGGDVVRDDQTGDLLQESDNTEINIEEEEANLVTLEEGVTLKELVQGLNSLGVTPRDLIAILQSLKAAGAIQAELKII